MHTFSSNRARWRVSERADRRSTQGGRHCAIGNGAARIFQQGADDVRMGAHGIGRLLECGYKRGPRHASHDRFYQPPQATRDIAAERDRLKFDIHPAIPLLVARDAE